MNYDDMPRNDAWAVHNQFPLSETPYLGMLVGGGYLTTQSSNALHLTEPLLSYNHSASQVMKSLSNTDSSSEINQRGFEKKEKQITTEDYPWLIAEDEFCHSDKQKASGKDISSVKRKYKKMLCIYCAEYNSATPWAHKKARKYDKETLNDHDNSHHHKKAVAALHAAKVCPTAAEEVKSNQSQPTSESNTSSYRGDTPAIQSTYPGLLVPAVQEFNNGNSNWIGNQFLPPVDVNLIPNVLIPTVNVLDSASFALHIPHYPPASYFALPNSSKAAFADSVYNTDMRPKAKLAPDWLQVDGKLDFSASQLASGKDLSQLKKKYKMIMCTYCAQYNPLSPWAVMKPRKFETAVLLEHEKSLNHRKAREHRDQVIAYTSALDNQPYFHLQPPAGVFNLPNYNFYHKPDEEGAAAGPSS